MKKLLFAGLTVVLASCNTTASTTPTPGTTGPAVVTPEKSDETPPPESVAVETVAATEPPLENETQTPAAETPDHAKLLNQLLFSVSTQAEGQEILGEIERSGDTRFVAGLIDVLRYQRGLSSQIAETLNALTEQDLPPDWFAWVEWAGMHPEIESFEEYPGWKANLFAQIDPQFLRFVHPGMKVAPESRVEEIVWGGVQVDGIPALDNPKMIDPAEADYLVPEERIFGVSLNGDTRAYPARFLDWHEMFNDIVGGEPVSLAY